MGVKELMLYQYEALIERVIDGDTIVANIDLGFGLQKKETLRLARIDAYETRLGKNTDEKKKKIGIESKLYLTNLIESKKVFIKTLKDKGKYGRYIVEIQYIDKDVAFNLNDHMVQKKFAIYKEF